MVPLMVHEGELQPAWTLILGPGPQMDLVRAFAKGLQSRHASVRLVFQATPLPEGPLPTPRGRLALCTSQLEGYHIPELQSFLEAHSGWDLVLIEDTQRPHLAQDLLGPGHVTWWPAPLRLEQAQFLMQPPTSRRNARLGIGGGRSHWTEDPGQPSAIVQPAQSRQSAASAAQWATQTAHSPSPKTGPTTAHARETGASTAATQASKGSTPESPDTTRFDDPAGVLPGGHSGGLSGSEMGAIQAILAGKFQPDESEEDLEGALPELEADSALESAPEDLQEQGHVPGPWHGSANAQRSPWEPERSQTATRPARLHPMDQDGSTLPTSPAPTQGRAGSAQGSDQATTGRATRSEPSLSAALLTALGAPFGPSHEEASDGLDNPWHPRPSSGSGTHLDADPPGSETSHADWDPSERGPAESGTLEAPMPPWYRDQIADLSDLAQRLHLDLFALEDAQGPGGPAPLGALREDVARLTQFTRTLGYLAAPPARGQQELSLRTLAQEQLATLAGLGPSAPRFLFKGASPALVQSDKGLLVGALDAILQVAAQCAGAHPATVRVHCAESEAWATLHVSFPPGPLQAWSETEVFEPYRLKESLPSIGPNALGASRAILRGQGGELAFMPSDAEEAMEGPEASDEQGLASFVLRLPLA